MLRGGLAGVGSRGGLGALDQVPQALYGWDAYRRRDPGGALVLGTTGSDDLTSLAATPLYIAGLRQFSVASYSGLGLTAFQGGGLVDGLYAIPQPLPDGKITRLVWACNGNAPASGNIRMGVFRMKGGTGSTNLCPGDMIHDSGSISFAGLGAKSAGAISGGGVSVSAGLYFFSVTCDADAAAGASVGPGMAETLVYPVGGCTVRWGNGEPTENDSLCIGWRHAQAFGAIPSVFPTSAPSRLAISSGNVTIPAIFYGFDPA